MKIAVITISDRASAGIYKDLSGPAVLDVMQKYFPDANLEKEIVTDDIENILNAFSNFSDADWIFTTGGTGPGQRDQTPEATRIYCDRMLPGISEYLRFRSLEETPYSVFSRGESGMRGSQFIVNFPGSEKAARFCASLLAPLMEHGCKMSKNEGH